MARATSTNVKEAEEKAEPKKTTTKKKTTSTTKKSTTARKKSTTTSKAKEEKAVEKKKTEPKKTATTKKTTTKKSTTVKKPAAKKATTKKVATKEEDKDKVAAFTVDLKSSDKIADKFRDNFIETYNKCTSVVDNAIEFINKCIISNPKYADYYKHNVIINSDGKDILEENSRFLAKTCNEYIKGLYLDDNQKNMSKLLIMNGLSDKDKKLFLLNDLANTILEYKLNYEKGTYIKSGNNLYNIRGYLNIMSSYYAQDKEDLSEIYNVILFNLNNFNNIIEDFFDKTLIYVYGLVSFAAASSIAFNK